ncbi:MAG: FKBP-type peptidyl-prolyl cis-trans isomerase [Saprospiraceae bacterium]
MKLFFPLILLLTVISFTACLGPTQDEKDNDIIQEYITKNKVDATKHSSGLYYVIKTPGTGVNPTAQNTVTVHYKGYFTDGTVFDGTTGTPVSFILGGLIPGWVIGIPLIKKGGEIQLILPSSLAYGPRGQGGIPPNTVLIFDITLVDVK